MEGADAQSDLDGYLLPYSLGPTKDANVASLWVNLTAEVVFVPKVAAAVGIKQGASENARLAAGNG